MIEKPLFQSTLIMDEIENAFAEVDFFEALIEALEEALIRSKEKA